MQNEKTADKKEAILSKIFLKEEDTLNQLEEIVELASKHFKVEYATGNIVFVSERSYSIPNKILLLLISRYIAKAGERIENPGLDISEIGNILSIKKTSLSKPLGLLIDDGAITKDERGKYGIIYHQIKKVLLGLRK